MKSPTTQIHDPLSQEEVEQRLQQHGYRLTRPRARIVQAILQHGRPFSAEQLVAELTEECTGIGRATIYRTLEVLASMDVLTRIFSPDGHPVYVSGVPGHRHHLLCDSCGTTVFIVDCPMDDLMTKLVNETHFVIHSHTLEVFGICPSCQNNKSH